MPSRNAAGRKRKAAEPCSSTQAEGGGAEAGAQAEHRVLGEPLPAHTVVLCLASERFQTQVDRWADEPAEAGPSSKRLAAAAAEDPGPGVITRGRKKQGRQQQQQPQPQPVPLPQLLLQLRVPLGSEEELPAALAAIKFAYTGHIEAGSIREVLQVRQQADYLQMKGCMEACVAAVREKLAAAPGGMTAVDGQASGGVTGATSIAAAAGAAAAEGVVAVVGPAAAGAAAAGAAAAAGPAAEGPAAEGPAAAGTPAAGAAPGNDAGSSSAGSGSTGGKNGATPDAPPPVLELYSCAQLWPDAEQEPAFVALLAEANPRLVAHFGDALAVLNKGRLFQQMLALPAVGLWALLESDEFGTDSESSVVLVLAEWMAVNYSNTDADFRKRLCGRLRLGQCSRAYTSWVLPALALDHLLHPDTQAGWFPITPQQASCVAYFATASDEEREVLLNDETGCPETWFSTQPRRQCVPPEGRSFSFSVSREDLAERFGALGKEQGSVRTLSNSYRPIEALQSRTYVDTYGEWGLHEEQEVLECDIGDVLSLGGNYGKDGAFKLTGSPPLPAEQQQQQKGDNEQEQQQRAREALVAAHWSRYLKDGKLTGRILVLRPGAGPDGG
ncbi:hypothetical protein HXX76_003162 [Chlamydomonas incerta]|uniref:BACK domain-containing protein n=1 Tax=Chlamydomonas incerta TaxID=51695 RepID=A0A835TCH4_CHLIN|nr:hypothetical protein HXX76_003162 [Chlamydomonas incerta]|eukprot:KAG2441541.1 hypothetical protein HXX76_003162 [Chlamydomonas incerta]